MAINAKVPGFISKLHIEVKSINQCSWRFAIDKSNRINLKLAFKLSNWMEIQSQPAFTYSKLTTETLEQGVKYVQS